MVQFYGVLIAVGALGILVLFLTLLSGRKKGEEAGELSQKAKDAIADIQEAVKKGDDAAVQAALIKHLKASRED